MCKKILAIILARGGSKRLKNKNTKKLNNKALINWTIDIASKSEKFFDILVSSDSDKILSVVKSNNKKILLLKRPKKFSGDKSSSEIAISHALKWYETNFAKVDYITLLQPTSPFRSIKTIKKGIQEIENSKINVVISIKKKLLNFNEKRLFYLTKNNFCKELLSKTSSKQKYVINGLFYLVKKNFFLRNQNFTPSNFKPIIIKNKKENIDIDTIDDWNYAKKFI